MQTLATEVITKAALAAGLPEGRVINQVASDNLTLDRPRVELQFLPATYRRTGRTLAFVRTEKNRVRKRELYEVEFSVAANILAEDDAWLADFAYAFVAALPRGANDKRGNWVGIRAEKATFGKAPDNRVGDEVIEVFHYINELYELTFTWRVTADEVEALIPTFTINVSMEAKHGQEG